MKTLLGLAGLALALSGCGAADGLKPAEGKTLPVAPYGAKTQPTPAQLLTPTTQQRPKRSDELMTQSQDRRSDEFNLPPPN